MPNYAENTVSFDSLEDLEKVVAFTSQISEADGIYQIEYIGTKICIVKNIGAKIGKSFPGLPEKMKLHLSDMFLFERSNDDETCMLEIRKQFHVGDYLIYERFQNALNVGKYHFQKVYENDIDPYKTAFNFNMIIPQTRGVINWKHSETTNQIIQPMNDPFFWFEWNTAHWGTKWKTFDVYVNRQDYTIEFQTAWTGVPLVIEQLAKIFPNTTIEYDYEEEEGYGENFLFEFDE